MMTAEDAALHRAQRSFRKVLDAFARPGEVRRIEVGGEDAGRPAALDAALWALAGLFVDQATTACVVDAEADESARYMAAQTHVRIVPAGEAAFVVVPGRADESCERRAVAEARCGTPTSPELGATVLVGCARVVAAGADAEAVLDVCAGEHAVGDGAGAESDEPAETRADAHADCGQAALRGLHVFEVSGPGVADVNRFAVSRSVWAEARAAREDEFPCGVDIVLVDGRGYVVAIPRTSTVMPVEEAR